MLCSLFYGMEADLLGFLSETDNNLELIFLVDVLSGGA